MDDSQLTRYARHIILDDFGEEGQERLLAARVALVGVGGLGSAAALYLAAAGVGELLLIDDDAVQLSNLQRQIVYSAQDAGRAKTQAAAERLHAINPHCKTRLAPTRLTDDNAQGLLAGASAVLDGSDNFATRHAVNRACSRLRLPLVFAAVAGGDAQLSTFDLRQASAPCYNCLFAEEDAAEDTPCALLGVLAPLAGMAGCAQALEALKLIAMPTARPLNGRLALLDGRAMRWREVAVGQCEACALCQARRRAICQQTP